MFGAKGLVRASRLKDFSAFFGYRFRFSCVVFRVSVMEGNGLKGAFGSEGGESGRKDTEWWWKVGGKVVCLFVC